MTGYPEWWNGWWTRAHKALKMYEPIKSFGPRPDSDYGDGVIFLVQLSEQIVLLESGEMVLLPKTQAIVTLMFDELRAIDPTRFPYYLWQEARKQTSDGKRQKGTEEA